VSQKLVTEEAKRQPGIGVMLPSLGATSGAV
jgi:hypothetical protein